MSGQAPSISAASIHIPPQRNAVASNTGQIPAGVAAGGPPIQLSTLSPPSGNLSQQDPRASSAPNGAPVQPGSQTSGVAAQANPWRPVQQAALPVPPQNPPPAPPGPPNAQPAPAGPKEWRPGWLEWPTLSGSIVITLLLIGLVVGFTIWSKTGRTEGIATVNLNSQHELFHSPNLTFGLEFTWSSLPVFIINVYVLLIVAIVNAAKARQPYVELRRPFPPGDGAMAEKSILLDYASEMAGLAPWKAFRRQHYGLTYSFTTMLLVQTLLSSITAYLFATRFIPVGSLILLEQPYVFDQNGFNGRSDLAPVIDIVAATRVYGGRPFNWTTLSESILPLSLEGIANTSNISTVSHAYSASLDCRVLKQPEEFVLGHTGDDWQFRTLDRGCGQTLQVFELETYSGVVAYIQTYSNVSCSLEAGSSRFIVVAALSANPDAPNSVAGSSNFTHFINKTAVSCIPSYFAKPGRLSIAVDPARPYDPTINSFTPTGPGLLDPRPIFAVNFETQLNQQGVVDNTETVHTNDFGLLLYNYAQKLSPEAYLTGETLQTAVEDLFTSSFAVAASRFLIVPTTQRSRIQSMDFVNKNRLIVVLPIACAIIAILVLVLIMLGWITFYSYKHHSVQYEDSQGLLGAAAVLRNSTLLTDVENISAQDHQGKVATEFNRARNAIPLADRQGWKMEKWEDPESARIVSTGHAVR